MGNVLGSALHQLLTVCSFTLKVRLSVVAPRTIFGESCDPVAVCGQDVPTSQYVVEVEVFQSTDRKGIIGQVL